MSFPQKRESIRNNWHLRNITRPPPNTTTNCISAAAMSFISPASTRRCTLLRSDVLSFDATLRPSWT